MMVLIKLKKKYSVLSFFWQFLKPVFGSFLTICLMNALSLIFISLVNNFILERFISAVEVNDFKLAFMGALFSLLCWIYVEFLNFYGNYVGMDVSPPIECGIRVCTFDFIQGLSSNYLQKYGPGYLENLIDCLAEGIRECTEVLHDDIIPGFFLVLGTLIYFFSINIYLCLGSFLWVCLHISLTYYLSENTVFYSKEHNRIGNERTKITMDFLKNYEIIQIYGQELFAKEKLHEVSVTEVELYKKYLRSNSIAGVLCASVMILFQGIFFGIVLMSMMKGLHASKIFVLFNMNLWFVFLVWDYTKKALNMIQSYGQMIKSMEIINQSEVNELDGNILDIEDSTIIFKNFSFHYENNLILNNLNFQINKNEKIAFLGASGCGKSTLIKILSHLIPVNSGIYIGNHALQEYNTKALRNQIAFVPQANDILDLSIKDNIMMNMLCTKEQFEHACDLGQVNTFINNLPNGMDTLAKYLSGGQKQRVNITRSILHTLVYPNTKYIFLDEPVSALDSITTQYIVNMVDELSKNRILICIDHSLYFCKYMDKIAIFKQDKSIEVNTFDYFIETDKEFKQMFYGQ